MEYDNDYPLQSTPNLQLPNKHNTARAAQTREWCERMSSKGADGLTLYAPFMVFQPSVHSGGVLCKIHEQVRTNSSGFSHTNSPHKCKIIAR